MHFKWISPLAFIAALAATSHVGTALKFKLPRPSKDSSSFDATGASSNICDASQSDLPLDGLGAMCAAVDTPKIASVIWNQILKIVFYKPPVGIVGLFTLTKLVVSGRIFRWDTIGSMEKAFNRENRKSRKKKHKGRAFQLDKDDAEYQKYGGIERARQRLCSMALTCMLHEAEVAMQNESAAESPIEQTTSVTLDQPTIGLVKAAADTIGHIYEPGTSPIDFVEHAVGDFANLEAVILTNVAAHGQKTIKDQQHARRVVDIAAATSEVRILDALLRTCRDQLLEKTFRLSRSQKHWRRRVESSRQSNNFISRFFSQKTIEGDRLRLAFADTAYKNEVARLGKILHALYSRPSTKDDHDRLTAAVIENVREEQEKQAAGHFAPEKKASTPKDRPLGLGRLFSQWTLRFNVFGQKKFSIYSYDDSLTVSGSGALRILAEHHDTDVWLSEAQQWCADARAAICEIVKEAKRKSISTADSEETDWDRLEVSWCARNYDNTESIAKHWADILDSARSLATLRRIGEGKLVRLKETTFYHWARQWDLLGLPMAACNIWLAHLVYKKQILPQIKEVVWKAADLSWAVIRERFWIPFRDLIREIFNRDKNSLMQSLKAEDEQQSLDFMLRDMGFGDGTAATRHEALLKASRQYESDLHTGLVRHALGGRLIRLILVQVQQLKVGLLSAVGTIDVLMQANQVNFRLLTVIPAILFATFGTKLFVRTLFNLRAKDIRPLKTVHSEMKEYLNVMQEIVLCADPGTNEGTGGTAIKQLKVDELGEFTFALHQYLVLFDYVASGFPKWQCDAMHNSLLALLGSQGTVHTLGILQHDRLMSHLKEKHDDLAKSL